MKRKKSKRIEGGGGGSKPKRDNRSVQENCVSSGEVVVATVINF